MLLQYAPVTFAIRRLGRAALAVLIAAASAAGSVGFFVHAAHISAALAQAGNTWCATCAMLATARVRSAGLPPENAVSIGVFLAGLAVVAGVQAIRFYNGSADR